MEDWLDNVDRNAGLGEERLFDNPEDTRDNLEEPPPPERVRRGGRRPRTVAAKPTPLNLDALRAQVYAQRGWGTPAAPLPAYAPAPPNIIEYSLSPPNVKSGSVITINWNVEDATKVRITPACRRNLPPVGTLDVTVNETTTFTLWATTAKGGVVEKSLTATVEDGAPPPPKKVLNPRFTLVTVTPLRLAHNGDHKVLIRWKAEHAETVTIEANPALEELNDEFGPESECEVVLGNTTTFVLTAHQGSKTVQSKSFTVEVEPPPPPKKVLDPKFTKVTITPLRLTHDGDHKVLIRWEAENTETVTIECVPYLEELDDEFEPKNECEVVLTGTTTFTLTAHGVLEKVKSESFVVEVEPPPVKKEPERPAWHSPWVDRVTYLYHWSKGQPFTRANLLQECLNMGAPNTNAAQRWISMEMVGNDVVDTQGAYNQTLIWQSTHWLVKKLKDEQQ